MLDNLYQNIGGKVKGLAKAIFLVEAVATIIAGLGLLFTNEDFVLYGVLTLVCGPVVAFVSSWVLYAFGDLVEDVRAIRNNEGTTEEKAKRLAEEKAKCELEESIDNSVSNPLKTVVPNKYKDYYSCPKCGCTLKFGQEECLCSWKMDWRTYDQKAAE